MARTIASPYGRISGRLGDVVAQNRGDKTVIYNYRPRKVKLSETQILHRNRVSEATSFVVSALDYFKALNQNQKSTRRDVVNSGIKKMKDICDKDTVLNYNGFQIAQKGLANVYNAEVAQTDNAITFEWEDNSFDNLATPEDNVMPLIYNEDRHESIYMLDQCVRKDQKAEFRKPKHWAGDKLQLFISSRSKDFSKHSTLEYLGELTVA